jgi:hypothetical protein
LDKGDFSRFLNAGTNPPRRFATAVASRRSSQGGDFQKLFMTQSESKVDVSVEERSLHLFKSERNEDLVAIGLAALLVLAVLLGVRV